MFSVLHLPWNKFYRKVDAIFSALGTTQTYSGVTFIEDSFTARTRCLSLPFALNFNRWTKIDQ